MVARDIEDGADAVVASEAKRDLHVARLTRTIYHFRTHIKMSNVDNERQCFISHE